MSRKGRYTADEDITISRLIEMGQRDPPCVATWAAIALALGRTVESVMWRALRCGLAEMETARVIPHVTRPCMICAAPFRSTGAHHRMCTNCRSVTSDNPLDPGPSSSLSDLDFA